MPALVPGVQSFTSFGGGPYTLSSDQEIMTIGASPAEAVVTPWYDMGVGATLARVQWSGTASGTIKGRTSAAKPPAATAMADQCLIFPGTWDSSEYYDPGLATLPAAQGWTDTVTGESLSGGYLTVPTTGNQKFRRYADGILPTGSKLIEINFRISHESGTGDQGVFGMLPMGTGTYTGQTSFYLSLSNSGAIKNSGTTIYTIPGFAASTFYDFWLVFRTSSSGTRPAYYEVWYRAAGSYDQDDLTGFVLAGLAATSASNDWTCLEWGGVWSGGTTCKWGKVRIFCASSSVDEYGWEAFSGSGDTSFARNQRFWQVKGWESGTLTELDLQSDLAAPGNPSGAEAAAVGASAIGGNCTSTATGAAAYYVECLDADAADAVVQADWVLTPAHAFRGLTVPGNYKVRFTSASDDGVRGSASVTTSSTAVPVASGALIGPSAAAPTIVALPAYTAPEIQYTGGAMRIVLATTRPTTWTLQKSTAGLTWSTDATQGTNPINDSALSYSGAVVGTSYATNHGWTLAQDTYYRLLPTYSDGSIGPTSNAIFVTTRSDYECTISGTMDEQWSASAVTARLEAAVVYGGQTYTTRTYSATINASGAWTLAGLPRGQVAIFRMPDNQEFRRTIGSSSSATFESLSAP